MGPGAPQFSVENLGTLLLKTTVAESLRAQLKPGTKVRVEVIGGGASTDEAVIRTIIPSADQATRRIPVDILVPNKDGRFVANQRADGLIIASPTGSTAYALSAGGPLLHPSIGGWVMVPIAPHTLSNRPIVLPDTSVITIEIVAGRDASVNFDMQSIASLLHGDRIRVQRSAHQVRFLHPRGWSYYATLRKKLHWYEGVGA